MIDNHIEVKFFTSHYLIRLLSHKLRIKKSIQIWLNTLSMSVFIYYYQIDFEYQPEYLASSTQKYPHMSKLNRCLVIYLIESLFFDQLNDPVMVLHHIASSFGLLLGLRGHFLGAINNCLLNELSSIWLSLFTLARKSSNRIINNTSFGLLLMFLYSFLENRVIPLTRMNYIFWTNINYFSKVDYWYLIFMLCIIHTSIQYYWLQLMLKKIILRIVK